MDVNEKVNLILLALIEYSQVGALTNATLTRLNNAVDATVVVDQEQGAVTNG